MCHAQTQPTLTRHVREVTRDGEAPSLGHLPLAQVIQFDIVLALRHQPELENFLQDLYDPSNPSYRHFLTVDEFTARFGPSQEDYDALIRFGKASGFTLINGSRDSMDVQFKASVANIQKAFHLTMGLYQHPTENRTFYSPDREPTLDLPFQVWHISGLDNYSIPRPAIVHRNAVAKSDVVTGSCPQNSYCGSDMRAAYYGATALTGTGQTVGLLEYAGYDIADVNTYFRNANQTLTVPVDGISTDGSTLSCLASNDCDDTEQTLDITQAVSMAPGLKALYVFVGNTDTAILSSMSTHSPLSAQLSSSWTWTPADPSVDDPFFEKFAAQGQNYFQAAGDSGSYSGSSPWPADSAYVTTVGGTDLQVTGPGGTWSSESAWSDGGGGYFGGDDILIPSWQQTPGVITSTNHGSTTYRNSPDVAAEANFDFYVCADQQGCTANYYGGTSFAAPMWAGYLALVNQQALANGNPVLGFINPAIYSLGIGANYASAFHDIKSGSNGYAAVSGFDLATGWGSPNGVALVNALAGTTSSPNFTLAAAPNNLTVTQGSNGVSTITIAPKSGFSGSVALSASGLPNGVMAAFNPTPATTSSTLTLTANATAATGTATISITGTSGSLTNKTTLTLSVNSNSSGAAVTLSPTSLTWGTIKVGTAAPERIVTVRNTGTTTLNIGTITTSGDFSQKIGASSCGSSLAPKKTCQIQVTFTPTQIGPRSGTLTVNDNASNSPQSLPLSGTGK